MKSSSSRRFQELDFFRGIAIIIMVVFHAMFDMREFYGYKVPGIYEWPLYYISYSAAILFMLVSGVASTLSRNNLKRALKFLGIALAISVVSYLYEPSFMIKFGIMHFFGVCALLSIFLVKLNEYMLIVMGVLSLVLGQYVGRVDAQNDYLFFAGIISEKFQSYDYYPLFPWLGIFIFGIVLGKMVYAKGKSIFGDRLRNKIVNAAGIYSLPVYLLHQPFILMILELVKRQTAGS